MKKKILLLTAVSSLALGAVGVALAFGAHKQSSEIVGDEDNPTISFDGKDLLNGESQTEVTVVYKSQDVTLKTDQNKNDVKFHYDNCGCYEFGGTYYFQVHGTNGVLYNVDEIRSMQSLSVRLNGTFKLEWGFEKDGDDIVYEKSTNINGSNTTNTYYFEYSNPNYFRISIVGDTQRQLTEFVITMKKGCVHGTSPYASKDGLAFRKYASYAKCVGFAGDPFASVVIPDEIDGLPVTMIGENAFYGKTGITSLTLPSVLETVSSQAFDGCTGITSLIIPKSVTSIGFCSFRDLRSCTSLSFEAGGTERISFGQSCFESIGHEGVLTLPSRISDFAPGVFEVATKVTAFALNSDNHVNNKASVADGVLFSTQWAGKYLEAYPCADTRTEYTIPSDVTLVRDDAGMSYAKNLVTLNIAPGNDGIYFESFSASNLTSLEHLNFGGTGNITFYWYPLRGASALKDIYITSNVIVANCGFKQICSDSSDPLTVHIPDAEKPSSWHSNWDGGDVASGYIVADYGYVA